MSAPARRLGISGPVAVAAACSGAAGLAYQVLWTRMLVLTLGSTIQAVCAVLSLFMIGLAAGSYGLGLKAERSSKPLRLYACLELSIALYALIAPWCLRLPSSLAALFLLPPTLLMGGTIPALVRHAVLSGRDGDSALAKLYFWNAIGGAMGALATGLILIPAIGLTSSSALAATANGLAALIAWRLSAREEQPASPAVESPAPPQEEPEAFSPVLWALLCVSGAMALAYEVVWTRLLALVLGSSTHSFTIVLAAFLSGIALGGLLADRPALHGRRGTGLWGWLQFSIAASGLAALALFPNLPLAYLFLFKSLHAYPACFGGAKFLLAFLTVLLPATLMGASFPFLVRLAFSGRISSQLGAALAASSAGSAAGPWIVNSWLVPLLGLPGAAAALALPAVAAGALAMWRDREGPWRTLAPMAAAGLLACWGWHPGVAAHVLNSGVFQRTWPLVHGSLRAGWKEHVEGLSNVRFAKDGAYDSVLVWESGDGALTLSVDGKPDASTNSSDMLGQLILGHLPMLLRSAEGKAPGRVLVVGLGSGVTAGAVARHPASAIDIVEIEPAVAEAAKLFVGANRGVLEDPRVRLFLDDARRHIARARTPYDVIVSEPSNPWLAGVSRLFTREFYRTTRAALAPGGLFCQWLPAYEMTPEALRTGLATFGASFEHASVWRVGTDLLLIGSAEPQQLDWDRLEAAVASAGVQEDLARFGLVHASDLLAGWTMGAQGLAALSMGVALHSDDRPILEFLAARALLLPETALGNDAIALLERHSESVSPSLKPGPGRARWLVRGLLALGRTEAAQRELALLPKADSWHDGLTRDLARLLLREGRADRALPLLEERLAARPNDPAARLDAAFARLASGDRPGAMRALETFIGLAGAGLPLRAALQAAKSGPGGPATGPAPLFIALGASYAQLNDREGAAEAVGRALDADPALLARTGGPAQLSAPDTASEENGLRPGGRGVAR